MSRLRRTVELNSKFQLDPVEVAHFQHTVFGDNDAFNQAVGRAISRSSFGPPHAVYDEGSAYRVDAPGHGRGRLMVVCEGGRPRYVG